MIVYDTQKNHDRIANLVNDYWDREGCKNVIDIRYVCEHIKEIAQTVIRGVRINNIFISCSQLESITGKKSIIDYKGGI